MADEYITKMDGNVLSENMPQKCATSTKNTQVLILNTCFVHSFSPGMQMCCHRPTYEIPTWRLKPEIVNLPLGITYLTIFIGYTYIFGGVQSKGRTSDTYR